jgi:pimeloyl-ACP methyl ester carboxylesterase
MLWLTSKSSAAFMLCLIALILSGCGGGYLGFWKQQHELKKAFQEEPSADLLRQLDPQDCFLLAGRFAFTGDYKKPVLVVAVTDRYKKREIVAERIIQPGVFVYMAYLPEGRYDLYFFADLDGNGYFDAHEMIGQTAGEPVQVKKSEVKDGLTVTGPAFTFDLSHPAATDLPVRVRVRDQAYAFDSLDDDFFDPKYGTLGLYNPMAFIAHTQRYVFSLEKLDPGKTMVLFVHGVDGTPRDFKYLVAGLDRNRYQPLFYFYPSGMPLQKLGSLLAGIIRYLTAAENFNVQRVIVVAHSMGGLVALSALNQLCSDGAPPYLKGYVSFNSPYGGVEDAKKGVENAPAVVPSWRDVATGSRFLEQLYKGPAPAALPFYLFFGYETGKSSDGTITLQSQLEPRVHFSAFKSYGFNATHMGILHNGAARQTFYRVLAPLDGNGK